MRTLNITDEGTEPKTDSFWVGWLAGSIKTALRQLEQQDAHGHTVPRDEVTRVLRVFWDQFAASEIGQREAMEALDEQLYDGFIVESATGEAQALRDTWTAAEAAIKDVESYWYEAETCGHPDAPRYVARLRPFKVRQITKAERYELHEYPAVIDREG